MKKLEELKKNKINCITTIALIGTFIAIYFHYVFMGHYLDLGWPINAFGQPPEFFANDFTRTFQLTKDLSPYQDMTRVYSGNDSVAYGPFGFLFFSFFHWLPSMNRALFLFYCIFTIIFFCINYNFFSIKNQTSLLENIKNTFIITFITFPFLFAIDRGNIEIYVFLFSFFGVYAYFKNNIKTASFFLILATAIKIYPGIFFLFYLRDKKYKEFFYAFIAGVLFVLICFSFFKGSLLYQIESFYGQLQLVNEKCLLSVSSCKALNITPIFKRIVFYISPALYSEYIVMLYNIFSFILLLFTFAIIYTKRLQKWQELTLFVILIFFIPALSVRYKLLFIFIPIYYFLEENTLDKGKVYNIFYSISFGLMLIPFYYKRPIENLYHFLLNSILFIAICREALRSTENDKNQIKHISQNRINYLEKIIKKFKNEK